MTEPARRRGRPAGYRAADPVKPLKTSIKLSEHAKLEALRARGYTVPEVVEAGIRALQERA